MVLRIELIEDGGYGGWKGTIFYSYEHVGVIRISCKIDSDLYSFRRVEISKIVVMGRTCVDDFLATCLT